MFELPKLTNSSKVVRLFKKISGNPVPKKFTYRFLQSLGFKSSKDREFLIFLKTLQFIDEEGRPTEGYFSFKDANTNKQFLAQKIQIIYAPLFKLDSAAHKQPNTVLEGYFDRLTGVGKEEVAFYVATFKELCSWADFEGITAVVSKKEISVENKPRGALPKINLNITLPSTTDEKVYESLFRHLKGLIDPQS